MKNLFFLYLLVSISTGQSFATTKSSWVISKKAERKTHTQSPLLVSSYWNQENIKMIRIETTGLYQQTTQAICADDNLCEIQENFCLNCIGNNLFMVNLFKNIGRTIVNSGESVDDIEFSNLLISEKFITVKADDIFNLIDAYDSRSAKRKFSRLCKEGTQEAPLVFVKVDRNRSPYSIEFVSCDGQIYYLTDELDLYQPETQRY